MAANGINGGNDRQRLDEDVVIRVRGLTAGFDMLTCARMGCVAAAEVISHIGARPEADLMELYRDHGLI